MHGILLINKPATWTSHDVVAKSRKILDEKRIGHLGTLDPLATGVLVLALGQATKLVEYLVGLDKVYFAEITLGATSNTFDAGGEIIATDFKGEVTAAKVTETLKSFIGQIKQVPPAFSAIKVKGQKAYDLARAGQKVTLPPRAVEIYKIDQLDFAYPKLILRVHCSSGTYVRSLAHDLGQKLGCGAYLSSLRRESVGSFSLDQACTLEQLEQGDFKLLTLSDAVHGWPQVVLDSRQVQDVRNGVFLELSLATNFDHVAAFDAQGALVAILRYDAAKQVWRSEKIIC